MTRLASLIGAWSLGGRRFVFANRMTHHSEGDGYCMKKADLFGVGFLKHWIRLGV